MGYGAKTWVFFPVRQNRFVLELDGGVVVPKSGAFGANIWEFGGYADSSWDWPPARISSGLPTMFETVGWNINITESNVFTHSESSVFFKEYRLQLVTEYWRVTRILLDTKWFLPLFSQTGQFTRVGFIKRGMNYTCRDHAFNCTAGIRRHIEHLVELKAEHIQAFGVRLEWDVVLFAMQTFPCLFYE